MIERKLKELATRLMAIRRSPAATAKSPYRCGKRRGVNSTAPGRETPLLPRPSHIAKFPSRTGLLLIEALKKALGHE